MEAMTTDKNQIRETLRKQRHTLTPNERFQVGMHVAKQIAALPVFQYSQHVAFYLADDGEVDPNPTLHLAEQQKKSCYLPVLHPKKDHHLEFYAYHSGDPLIENQYGIGEPDIKKQTHIDAEKLDLVLMPLVAFDENGNRVGRGAGFYDRTFSFKIGSKRKTPLLVGLAYEFQKINVITAADWDVALDLVVTEQKIYRK